MRLMHSVLAAAALIGLSLTAHADTLYYLNNGVVASSGTTGTLSGTFTVNTITDTIRGGSLTFMLNDGSVSETFAYYAIGADTASYTYTLFKSGGDTIYLYTTPGNSPLICTSVAPCSGKVSTVATTSTFLVSSATVSLTPPAPVPVAATPEPSSLILLGTGILGVAGATRRRFSKA